MENSLTIRKAAEADIVIILQMAMLLWPAHTREALMNDMAQFLCGEDAATFLCLDGGQPVGFALCQLRRDYVEGAVSSPVGYLEGLFVVDTYRRRGIAVKLLKRCELWAWEHGCEEFASDCELGNQNSLAFHLRSGFIEANRVICLIKKLD